MPDLLADIAEAAEALADGRHHTEAVYRDHDDKRTNHTTVVPGLIQQLREAAEPGNDGEEGGRGGRESVPVAIDAVSLLAAVSFGAAKRIHDAIADGLRVEARTDAEGNIRALVGIAARLPYDRTRVDGYLCGGAHGWEYWVPCHRCQPTTQVELRSELMSWRWQAEIVTGWRTPPVPLLAPCPACDARGTLLAYPDPADTKARCTGCGQEWAKDPAEHEGAIGMLARHVETYQDMSHEDRREFRRLAVERRQRAEGRAVNQAA
jgi:hypothetical protein